MGELSQLPAQGATWAQFALANGIDKPAKMVSNDITSPTVSRLHKDDMKMFGGEPLNEELVIVSCNSCKKSLLPSAFSDHLIRCSADKSRKTSIDVLSFVEGLEESLENPHFVFGAQFLELMQKRRKLGIIDIDFQCCVASSSGIMCSRPITCKVHSMFQKSQVVRTKDFCHLLREYHKRLSEVNSDRIEEQSTQSFFVQQEPIITIQENFVDQSPKPHTANSNSRSSIESKNLKDNCTANMAQLEGSEDSNVVSFTGSFAKPLPSNKTIFFPPPVNNNPVKLVNPFYSLTLKQNQSLRIRNLLKCVVNNNPLPKFGPFLSKVPKPVIPTFKEQRNVKDSTDEKAGELHNNSTHEEIIKVSGAPGVGTQPSKNNPGAAVKPKKKYTKRKQPPVPPATTTDVKASSVPPQNAVSFVNVAMDPALLFGNGSEQIKRQKVDDTVSLSGSNESGASNLPMLAVQGPVKKQRAKKPPGAKNPNPKKKKASMPIIAGDVVVTNAPAPSNDQMIIDSTQIG